MRLGATVERGTRVRVRHICPFLDANPGIEMNFVLSRDLLTPLLREDVGLTIDCVAHASPELGRKPLFRETCVVAGAPDDLAAHRIGEPAALARHAGLSIDEEGGWWERFLGAFLRSRRPSLGRVFINYIRGRVTAGVNGLAIVVAPGCCLKAEIDPVALSSSPRRSASSVTASRSTGRRARRASSSIAS